MTLKEMIEKLQEILTENPHYRDYPVGDSDGSEITEAEVSEDSEGTFIKLS